MKRYPSGRMRFFKYNQLLLIAMLLILFVPMLILGAFFLKQCTDLITDNEISKDQYVVDQMTRNMDDTFREILQISYQIPRNPALSPNRQRDGNTPKMAIINELENYILTSAGIKELAIYYRGDQRLYYGGTSSGSCPLDFYVEELFHYEGLDGEEFQRQLDTIRQIEVLPEQDVSNIVTGTYRALTMLVPLSNGPGSVYGVLLFSVDTAPLQQAFQRAFPEDSDEFFLYYADNVIYSHRNKKSAPKDAPQFSDLTLDTRNGISIHETESHVYLISKPQASRFSYLVSMNTRRMYGNIEAASKTYWIIFTAVFLLGFLLVNLLWRATYRPVKRLLSITTQSTGEAETGHNEFDTIKSAFEVIAESNRTLTTRVESTADVYRDHLLLSLLKGVYPSRQMLAGDAADTDLVLDKDYISALALCLKDRSQIAPDIIVHMIQYAEKILSDEIVGYGRLEPHTGIIQFLIATDFADDQKRADLLNDFYDELVHHWGLELSAGCGSFVTDPSELPACLNEAMIALDYRIVYGYNRIIHFRDIDTGRFSGDWYPTMEMKQFEAAAKTKNPERAKAMFHIIMDNFQENGTPLYVVKFACSDMIRFLSHSLFSAKEAESQNITYLSIIHISRHNTFVEVRRNMEADVEALFDHYESKLLAFPQNQTCERVREFIDVHYLEYDFSIHTLTEEFKMSETTLRKIFKEVMNTTYLDYVLDKRISKAKQLLATTDLQTKEIAEQIGYTNVSAFIRRFKEKTALTPGDYRVSCNAGEEDD